MSWMSPLTVPITILPMRGAPVSTSSGFRMNMPALHRVGGQQHFGHEQDAVAEVGADDGHAGDQRLGQHVIGRPAARDQDVDAFFDLFLQTVVKVVVHLQHKFVVGKFGEDDFVRRPWGAPCGKCLQC